MSAGSTGSGSHLLRINRINEVDGFFAPQDIGASTNYWSSFRVAAIVMCLSCFGGFRLTITLTRLASIEKLNTFLLNHRLTPQRSYLYGPRLATLVFRDLTMQILRDKVNVDWDYQADAGK
jgi:hypothetical protein